MKINKGQFSLNSRIKGLAFHIKRGEGHLARYIVNRIKWHYYPRLRYVGKFPDHVDLEISTICNLNCPMCYTTTDEFKRRVQKTLMDFTLFKKLIDECAEYGSFSVRLSLRGEAFLHPDIIKMIRYAKEKGIKEVSALTNGFNLNEDFFSDIMNSGLDWLTISVDGIGETYERIRRPAKFNDIFEKIRHFSEIKRKKGFLKPVIKVQTLWPAIKDDPKVYYDLFRPVVDEVASNPLIDYLHNDDDIEYVDNFTCPVLWQRLTVGSDGRALLCVNDEMGRCIIGDLNNETLYKIWHGKQLNEARNIHEAHAGVKMLEPCKRCYLPRRTTPSKMPMGEQVLTIENYTHRCQEIGK